MSNRNATNTFNTEPCVVYMNFLSWQGLREAYRTRTAVSREGQDLRRAKPSPTDNINADGV